MKCSIDVPVMTRIRVDVSIAGESLPSGVEDIFLARVQALGAPIGLDEESREPLVLGGNGPAGIRMLASEEQSPEPSPSDEDENLEAPKQSYVDEKKSRQVFVGQGLGHGDDAPWMSFWKSLDGTGGTHRLKSPRLPERATQSAAQRDLNEYAADQKWPALTDDKGDVIPDEAIADNALFDALHAREGAAERWNDRKAMGLSNFDLGVAIAEELTDDSLTPAVDAIDQFIERVRDILSIPQPVETVENRAFEPEPTAEAFGPLPEPADPVGPTNGPEEPVATEEEEPIVIPPISTIARIGDYFVRLPSIASAGMSNQPRKILNIDDERIHTDCGIIIFEKLDKNYRLVMDVHSVHVGDVLTNKFIASEVCEINGDAGISLRNLKNPADKPTPRAWSEIDGKWFFISRASTTAAEPADEPPADEPVLTAGSILQHKTNPERQGEVLEIEETAALVNWGTESSYLSLEAVAESYTITSKSEVI